MFGASSQHVDIAALLIKFNTCVNATDKWAFTPLHEAAQKGRTQLCALLLAHGADPTMKNQEGQTALDLATVTASVKQTDIDQLRNYCEISRYVWGVGKWLKYVFT